MKENWTYKKLGEVATFSRGLTFAKGDVADMSSKKVLRSNNIDLNSHSLNFDDVACLNEDFVIPDEKKLHKGDIFICMSNGSTQHLGKVAFIEEDLDYALGGFMGAIHPNQSETNPKFVFYACLSSEYRRFLASVFNGVNINNLKWSDLSKFSIPVPPLETQSRIVSELDLLQFIIDKQQAQLKELDKLAQAVFYDMFGDPVENEKGWEVKKMEEVCYGIGDGLHGTPQYDPNGLYAFINGNNLIDGRITITDRTLFVNDAEAQKIFITMDTNTILLSINGTLGKTAIYNNEKIVLGKSACYCKLKDVLSAKFVLSLMNTQKFQLFLENHSSKSTIKNVGLKAIRNYKIILPSLSLQQSFAAKIESIEKQKSAISQSIAETQKLFNYTMDKYFG